jgi:threonine dehydrogenase-like Zn-dependent dehydrogenase
MELGIRLIGNGQAPVLKYWEELLEQIRAGKLDPGIMVSHRIDLEDVAKAYRVFDAKQDNMMKVFVQTKFSGPPAAGTPALKRL